MSKTNKISNDTKEMFRKPKKSFLPITSSYINHKWTIDLMEYKSKNAPYIMVCVDVYSRKAGAWIMKDKYAKTALEAFLNISENYYDNSLCEILMTDDGSEFKKEMKAFIREKDILHQIAPNDTNKFRFVHYSQGIAERFISTLRLMIKYFLEENSLRDITAEDLKSLLYEYNNRKHRHLVKATPNDIYYGLIEKVIKPYEHNITQKDIKFYIGDTVRILLQKKLFANKKQLNYSREVYKIIDRENNRFTVMDSKGKEFVYPYTRLLLSKSGFVEKKTTEVEKKTEEKQTEKDLENIYEIVKLLGKNKKRQEFKVKVLYDTVQKGDKILYFNGTYFEKIVIKSVKDIKNELYIMNGNEEIKLQRKKFKRLWYFYF